MDFPQSGERLIALLAGARPALLDREWQGVVDEASRHRVAPLLYSRIRGSDAQVPPETLARLRDIYTRFTLRSALLLREVDAMLRALRAAGIEPVLLKGASLALSAYGEPAFRSMADLDVLVHRDQLAAAERALIALGYGAGERPDIDQYTADYHHIAPLDRPGSTRVEVHWTIERPTSPFRIDLDGLWERARTIEAMGLRVLVPSPEDQLLHLSLHASYHHRFDRAALKYLCDIAAVVDRAGDSFDWPLAVRIAHDSGAGPFVRCTLRLAHRLLGVAVPQSAIHALDRAQGEEALLRAARNYIVTPPEALPSAIDQLARRRSVPDRIRLVGETIFPGRDVIAALHNLPAGSNLWLVYAALRPLELLVRRGRIAAQILFRSRALRPALRRESDRRRLYEWIAQAETEQPSRKSA